MTKIDVDNFMVWLQELVVDDDITRTFADRIILILGTYLGEKSQDSESQTSDESGDKNE